MSAHKCLADAILVVGLVLLGACGASFVGPATADPGDRCGGHLDCGAAGCCSSANMDGEGWSCNPPGYSSVCEYVGLSDNGNGMFGAKRGDAGR